MARNASSTRKRTAGPKSTRNNSKRAKSSPVDTDPEDSADEEQEQEAPFVKDESGDDRSEEETTAIAEDDEAILTQLPDDDQYAPQDTHDELKTETTLLAEDAESVEESSEPSAKSSEPSAKSSEPSAKSSEPSAKSSEPSAKSSEPSTESREPSTESSEPSTESSEPSAESSEPSVESSEPTAKSSGLPPTKEGPEEQILADRRKFMAGQGQFAWRKDLPQSASLSTYKGKTHSYIAKPGSKTSLVLVTPAMSAVSSNLKPGEGNVGTLPGYKGATEVPLQSAQYTVNLRVPASDAAEALTNPNAKRVVQDQSDFMQRIHEQFVLPLLRSQFETTPKVRDPLMAKARKLPHKDEAAVEKKAWQLYLREARAPGGAPDERAAQGGMLFLKEYITLGDDTRTPRTPTFVDATFREFQEVPKLGPGAVVQVPFCLKTYTSPDCKIWGVKMVLRMDFVVVHTLGADSLAESEETIRLWDRPCEPSVNRKGALVIGSWQHTYRSSGLTIARPFASTEGTTFPGDTEPVSREKAKMVAVLSSPPLDDAFCQKLDAACNKVMEYVFHHPTYMPEVVAALQSEAAREFEEIRQMREQDPDVPECTYQSAEEMALANFKSTVVRALKKDPNTGLWSLTVKQHVMKYDSEEQHVFRAEEAVPAGMDDDASSSSLLTDVTQLAEGDVVSCPVYLNWWRLPSGSSYGLSVMLSPNHPVQRLSKGAETQTGQMDYTAMDMTCF